MCYDQGKCAPSPQASDDFRKQPVLAQWNQYPKNIIMMIRMFQVLQCSLE